MEVNVRILYDATTRTCVVTDAGCGCCASPYAVVRGQPVVMGYDQDGVPIDTSDDPEIVSKVLRTIGEALLALSGGGK